MQRHAIPTSSETEEGAPVAIPDLPWWLAVQIRRQLRWTGWVGVGGLIGAVFSRTMSVGGGRGRSDDVAPCILSCPCSYGHRYSILHRAMAGNSSFARCTYQSRLPPETAIEHMLNNGSDPDRAHNSKVVNFELSTSVHLCLFVRHGGPNKQSPIQFKTSDEYDTCRHNT